MLGFVQFHCPSDVTQNHHITKDVLTKHDKGIVSQEFMTKAIVDII